MTRNPSPVESCRRRLLQYFDVRGCDAAVVHPTTCGRSWKLPVRAVVLAPGRPAARSRPGCSRSSSLGMLLPLLAHSLALFVRVACTAAAAGMAAGDRGGGSTTEGACAGRRRRPTLTCWRRRRLHEAESRGACAARRRRGGALRPDARGASSCWPRRPRPTCLSSGSQAAGAAARLRPTASITLRKRAACSRARPLPCWRWLWRRGLSKQMRDAAADDESALRVLPELLSAVSLQAELRRELGAAIDEAGQVRDSCSPPAPVSPYDGSAAAGGAPRPKALPRHHRQEGHGAGRASRRPGRRPYTPFRTLTKHGINGLPFALFCSVSGRRDQTLLHRAARGGAQGSPPP